MTRLRIHKEGHRVERAGWLRASVLGANDGLVSTASLIVGVAAASAGSSQMLVAGVAGLVAGAMSMAAGEYVSVSSQADAEKADLARETKELASDPEAERDELTGIYLRRGLDSATSRTVALQLMEKDALGAHARDELGISDLTAARPIQAALASATSFAIGAVAPLLVAFVTPTAWVAATVSASALVFLAVLGVVGAKAGGAEPWRAATRVTFWGAMAMAVTAGIGRLIGVAV